MKPLLILLLTTLIASAQQPNLFKTWDQNNDGQLTRHELPEKIHACKAAIRWIKANAAKFHLDPANILPALPLTETAADTATAPLPCASESAA